MGGAGGGVWRSTLCSRWCWRYRKRGRGGEGSPCSRGRGDAQGGAGLERGAQRWWKFLTGVGGGVRWLWSPSRATLRFTPRKNKDTVRRGRVWRVQEYH